MNPTTSSPSDACGDPQTFWPSLLSKIQNKIGRHCFDTWFVPVAFAGCDALTLRLNVPNEGFGKSLLHAYGDLLRQTVEEVLGAPRGLLIASAACEPPATSTATLPVVQAAALEKGSAGCNWLIEKLWLAQAVGFLGSPPKHFKTWLAMEMAVSVASGTPCLGSFPVPTPGPVLLYAAEDSASAVRQRLESLALHHRVDLDQLPLWVITADSLRLDRSDDREKLEATVVHYQPRLLILDPLIRLHQQDENASGPMAALLGFFRSLQRKARLAIALVHHSRKSPAPAGAGYSLRGSSDFYAWTDAFLHLHRRQGKLMLTAEHRAAPPFGPAALELVHPDGGHPHLALSDHPAIAEDSSPDPGSLAVRILELLMRASCPLTTANLRSSLRVRNQRLVESLQHLATHKQIRRTEKGYVLLQGE
ncbi:MAG: hypothetical protein FJ280_10205 [Planctomycetes bacterium]|nr:hypothetical protein [Planctomycetota bacterium]